jgi:hypothetical protein
MKKNIFSPSLYGWRAAGLLVALLKRTWTGKRKMVYRQEEKVGDNFLQLEIEQKFCAGAHTILRVAPRHPLCDYCIRYTPSYGQR